MRALSLGLALLAVAAVTRAAEPVTGKIVYPRKTGTAYRLHVMNADGTGDRELPGQTQNANAFPTWSPDGKQIAWMAGTGPSDNNFKIVVANADGSNHRVLTTAASMSGFPAWSPDGKKLAFAAGEQMPNVYVADPDGTAMRQLNPEGSGGILPFWMSDGQSLGYTRFQSNEVKSALMMAKVDGSGTEVMFESDKLVAVGANGRSPDGKRLVYVVLDPMASTASLRVRDLANKSELFLDEAKVPSDQGPELFLAPAWAPDGKSFVVSLPTEKGFGLFRISEDGKTRTRLTPEGVDCLGGSWTAH